MSTYEDFTKRVACTYFSLICYMTRKHNMHGVYCADSPEPLSSQFKDGNQLVCCAAYRSIVINLIYMVVKISFVFKYYIFIWDRRRKWGFWLLTV